MAEESGTLPSYPFPVPTVPEALQTAAGRGLVLGLHGAAGRGLRKLGDQTYLGFCPGSSSAQLCDQGRAPFLLQTCFLPVKWVRSVPNAEPGGGFAALSAGPGP